MIRGLLLALAFVSGGALAEQKQAFGDYVVHYSAQNCMDLSPEVARQYGIARVPRLAMVMITVQTKTGVPQAATVSGQARNLLGQTQVLEMREIREGAIVYYLGLLNISNLETQTFDFGIQPDRNSPPSKLRFSQQFFVD